jgi:uncharacterized membrane protein YebE (DUF533 family)
VKGQDTPTLAIFIDACKVALFCWAHAGNRRMSAMGLMRTLVNVAVGVAIAKGVQAMTGRGRAGRSSGGGGGGGLGGALGNVLSGGSTPRAGRGTRYEQDGGTNGLEGVMDGILGRGRSTGRAPRANAPAGGLEDLLQGSSAQTGRGGTAGGFGDLLGGMLGGTMGATAAPRTLPEPREETLEAAVLLRCMIQAAKCDGDLDADEKAKLMEAVGQADKAEIAFVNAELSAAVDVDTLVRQIPNGMEEKAYLVSLMAIDLDQRAEAEYLHGFATALELGEDEVNKLHDQVGAPRIYK